MTDELSGWELNEECARLLGWVPSSEHSDGHVHGWDTPEGWYFWDEAQFDRSVDACLRFLWPDLKQREGWQSYSIGPSWVNLHLPGVLAIGDGPPATAFARAYVRAKGSRNITNMEEE